VYHLGDAVVVKKLDHPQVGDIIVFHIPKGEPAAGMLVVHRIHAIRSDGTFETKGDNRRYPDPFKITTGDIVGSPAWTLPHFGRLIGLASSPFVVGGAVGLIAMMTWIPKALKDDKDDKDKDEDDTADTADPDDQSSVDESSDDER
jgi:signal peptidase I